MQNDYLHDVRHNHRRGDYPSFTGNLDFNGRKWLTGIFLPCNLQETVRIINNQQSGKMEITRETAESELSRFREKHGITQEALSEKTEVAINTIISIEKGRKKPQATTIFKLNRYLSTFD